MARYLCASGQIFAALAGFYGQHWLVFRDTWSAMAVTGAVMVVAAYWASQWKAVGAAS